MRGIAHRGLQQFHRSWPASRSGACLPTSRRSMAMRPMAAAGQPVVIAIDGPAASGKGTLAKRLSQAYNLAHLDTGLLYRAVALKALQAQLALDDEAKLAQLASNLTPADVNPKPEGFVQLRSEAVGSAASKVSALPAVRAAVNAYPRTWAQQLPAGCQGCILDGRDVGTVLFPDAQLKLFLVASAEVRAERRLLELRSRGDTTTTYESVLKAVIERDARDSGRQAAPLVAASDAVLLDSSQLSEAQVYDKAAELIASRCPQLRVQQAV